MFVPVWALFVVGLTILTLVLMLWSVKRRRGLNLKLDARGGITDLIPSIAGITQGTLVEGNHVELVQNGTMWDRAISDLGL